MSIWSSYSECFYRSLLESPLNNKTNKGNDTFSFNNYLDTSCSNISSFRNPPKPTNYYSDHLFYVSDSLNSGEDDGNIYQTSAYKIPTATVIHKYQGNSTCRRINNLLYTSGNLRNSIYCAPYESSQYTFSNVTKYMDKGIFKKNIFNELKREIINCTDSVYLYNNNSRRDLKHVVIKPSGAINAGVMGLEINANVVDDNVVISTNEVFTVYPSCFFYYEDGLSNYFMDPYVNTGKKHFVQSTWDGYSLKSKLHGNNKKYVSVHEDLDLLEVKAQNLSIYSTTVYARNPFGIYVFRYYFDEEWKIKTLNNASFKKDEKVYYMALSPYISDDAVFLKTTHEMLIYDGCRGHERDTISLSSKINTNKDIIQTVSYGMDNNSLILGGNKLYQYDRRSNILSDLILPVQSSITVTRVRWTERKFDFDYPSQHFKSLLGGRNCSFSSYYRTSNPSFWSSFTACEVHPVYNYILATVCGTSDCILIFDLRIPNAPVVDIPLPSTRFMSSRFRSLKWHYVDGLSYLFAFSWRSKHPIVARFVINSSFYNYKPIDSKNDLLKGFENIDYSYDTTILFDRSTILNFSNTDELQEGSNFPSYGTSIRSEDYFELPLQFTNENLMTNIFHGYLGFTVMNFKTQKINLGFVYTTSGRLICLDLNNRNVLLDDSILLNKNKVKKTKKNKKSNKSNESNLNTELVHIQKKNNSHIVLEDENNTFNGIIIRCNDNGGLKVPEDMEFTDEFKYIRVKKFEIKQPFNKFTAVNLNDIFVKIQEQHFGDEKMYTSVSVNNMYLNEIKLEKFNSKEILKRILEFKKNEDEDTDKGDIMPLSQFEKLYPKEKLKWYNHWNPLDNSIDELEELEDKENKDKNKYNDLCSCSIIRDLLNEYRKMISNNDTNHDDNVSDNNDSHNLNIENELNIDLLEKLIPLSFSVNNDNNRNSVNNQTQLNCMNVDHTNIEEKDRTKHRIDCRRDDLICVEIEKEYDNEEFHSLVNEIVESWVVERNQRNVY